ncbi:MAG: glutathione S-transferase [Caulobacter sp.]|nr:glutathione S-transferase [Caulobacter sp.]
MALEVIEHPLSPYAQKVKIALTEKGQAFTTSVPLGMGSSRTPEDFQAANPRGEVPVLMVDGQSLFDSTIILEFIEDRWPEPALLPKDPMARAKARTIEEMCDTHYEAITWGLGEIGHFRRAEGEHAAAMQAKAGEQLGRLNAWLEKHLNGADWFGGDRFGWADLSAAPFVNIAAGFGHPPAQGGALAAWLERVRARPSVATAFRQSFEALAAMSQVAGLVESGLFKRQYRDYRLEWMIRSGGLDVVVRGVEKANIRFNEEPR